MCIKSLQLPEGTEGGLSKVSLARHRAAHSLRRFHRFVIRHCPRFARPSSLSLSLLAARSVLRVASNERVPPASLSETFMNPFMVIANKITAECPLSLYES